MDILKIVLKIVTSKAFYVPIFTYIFAKILTKVSKKVVEKVFLSKDANSIEAKRKKTIISLMENITKYSIWGMSIIIILSSWGFDVTGVIAGLGVVGVVAGLALQDALKDIIAGANIIMDNFFVLGDKVTINGFTGDVIEFSIKNTKIQNINGEVLVIANREIAQVINLSKKTSSVDIKVPIAYEGDTDKALKVLDKVKENIDSFDLSTKPTEVLGVDELNSSSVDYLIRAYCKAGNQYDLKRKMLKEVKDVLDKNNIKIPYNQIEVHNG